MKILCCGDKNWDDITKIEDILRDYPNTTIIIHGNAKGADTLVATIAFLRKISVESFPANWSQYGRAAGPIRNQLMLDEGKPDLVIAFHTNLDTSKGTKDMIKRATKAGIPVRIIT